MPTFSVHMWSRQTSGMSGSLASQKVVSSTEADVDKGVRGQPAGDRLGDGV